MGVIWFRGVAGARHDHRGNRWQIAQGERALFRSIDVGDLLRVEERVAARLEHATEGRELRKDGMTGFAGKSGLPGETGYRVSRLRKVRQSRYKQANNNTQQPLRAPWTMRHSNFPSTNSKAN